MRRDVCYVFDAEVQNVYNAYLAAATNDVFRRSCKEEPFHTISFGLNFSMKYNMNGGACTLHFIPYGCGTAVDIRFSIAQAAGARYQKYADTLTNAAEAVLGKNGMQVTNIPIETFLDPANQVTLNDYAAASASAAAFDNAEQPRQTAFISPEIAVPTPASTAAPVFVNTAAQAAYTAPVYAPTPALGTVCANCGHVMDADALFCSQCGTKKAPQARFCTKCGKEATPDAVFCTGCGNKL